MNKESDIGLLNVSPYDDSFPARLLSQAFDFSIEESDIVTNKIYSEVVKNSVNPAMYINPGEKRLGEHRKQHVCLFISQFRLNNA